MLSILNYNLVHGESSTSHMKEIWTRATYVCPNLKTINPIKILAAIRDESIGCEIPPIQESLR